MVLYPDAQRRAHEEIDRVIPGRLPTLEDRDDNRLPYVNSILTESYRWAPPAPFGEHLIYLCGFPRGPDVMSFTHPQDYPIA